MCQNPYLLKRPDRLDPAIDSVGFAGAVLEPLLKQGEEGRFRLVSGEAGPFGREARAR